MKTFRLHAPGVLRLHDEPDPVPNAGEVVVRISVVGLCGSDLHWFEDAGIGDTLITRPLVLGHEMAGIVETGRLAGQLVAIDPAVPCGRCEFCLQGSPNLCSMLRFAGNGLDDGGLQERIAWPERCLYTLPPSFSAADGAMLEPLGVALYAVDLSSIRPGMTVGIFGCGPIGLLILQLALRSGASLVVATEKIPHRLQAAADFGARTFLADGSETAEIEKLTHSRGLDVVIDAAGDNAAVDAAISAVKPGGNVTLAGIPSDDRTSLRASSVRRKGLALQWVRRMKFTYPRAIDLVLHGSVDVRSLVTHRYPLVETQAAFENAQQRKGLKTLVQVAGSE
jgi:L-iditol 2-dehydrogenase